MLSFKFDNDYVNDNDNDNESLIIDEINNTFGFNIHMIEIFPSNMISPDSNIFNPPPYYKDNTNYIAEESHHLNTNKDNNAEKNQNTNKNESSTGLTYKNKEILPEFYPINIILEKVSNDKIKNKLKLAELEKTNECDYMGSLNKIWK